MKKILVTRSSMPPFEEYVEEIKSLWDSHWLTNKGEKHEKFREVLKEYLQVPGISLFTNGHTALEVSLRSLNLNGEVITTPFTFVSTTHAIVNNSNFAHGKWPMCLIESACWPQKISTSCTLT